MLEKITTGEIMTRRDASFKYRTQYIMMMITEEVDNGDNDLGYVMYVAEDKREFRKVDMNEYRNKRIALLVGWAAEPYPSLGNVVYYD